MKILTKSLAVLAVVFSAMSFASSDPVQQLRLAMFEKDLPAFDAVLDSGSIGLDGFATNPFLYEVFCASTYHTYAAFFERLLEYGVNPSVQSPESNAIASSYPISCAATRSNFEAFNALLDAGADSTVNLCEQCAYDKIPLITHVLSKPDMFVEITRRRDLTDFELSEMARRLEVREYHKNFNGKPVMEYYTEFLRERGFEITPAGANR